MALLPKGPLQINVQDPPAEGSPGTFRIGALLEGSLLLLV